jgi:hypothetical protein
MRLDGSIIPHVRSGEIEVTRIADNLIERELLEMAMSPKQQEVLNLIRKHMAPVSIKSAQYGRKAESPTNYELRWYDQRVGVGVTKMLPTRPVKELIKNNVLQLVQAADGYGKWNIKYIPTGDDPADYGIKVWDK